MWASNLALHNYYTKRGFRSCGRCARPPLSIGSVVPEARGAGCAPQPSLVHEVHRRSAARAGCATLRSAVARGPVAGVDTDAQGGARMSGQAAESAMPLQFNWTSFDLTNRLPVAWQDQVIATATSADFRHFPRTPVISREAGPVASIPRGRVHADRVDRNCPGYMSSTAATFSAWWLACTRKRCSRPGTTGTA